MKKTEAGFDLGSYKWDQERLKQDASDLLANLWPDGNRILTPSMRQMIITLMATCAAGEIHKLLQGLKQDPIFDNVRPKPNYAQEYYIISKDGLFWSNSAGWVDIDNATKFTESERQRRPLPIGGNWVPIGIRAIMSEGL